MALWEIIWDFGDIIQYILVFFVYKMYLFAITAYFPSFPDKKTLWFSSPRRREGVVGEANSRH